MATKAYSDDDKDKAVGMYLAGKDYDEIFAETGVPQGSVLWHVRKAGHSPNRRVSGASYWQGMWEESQAEVERLKGELEAERARNGELQGKLNEALEKLLQRL